MQMNELKQEGFDKEAQTESDESYGNISEKTSIAGDKPGEKLYSSEPEKLETHENAEEFSLKLKGTEDESGTKRDTISTGKGEAATKRILPRVDYDDSVQLSAQQKEDDSLERTLIPLEYEEIIKKIHSEKE